METISIQWIFISHHTSQRKKYIHQNEKKHGQCKASSFYTLSSFNVLGNEEERVVNKEWPGIGGGNNK